MKTAIYIEDGIVQLVITPESEFEKAALRSFEAKPIEAKVFSGTFYDCRGGWIRQSGYFDNRSFDSADNNDKSLILRMSEPKRNITMSSPAQVRGAGKEIAMEKENKNKETDAPASEWSDLLGLKE